MNTQANRIREKYRALFGSEPGVWFSPGRINLIGEHVDYNDGYVMPAAINKGVWFAIARNDSDTIRFHAGDLDESFSIPVQQLQRQEGWKNYVLGVLHELRL
ncbi:MAG TPA: galactokinase family protein, partial [Ferruginibacter sp.]|nr:galactokinase family protein [Ferruginibacter sp.]